MTRAALALVAAVMFGGCASGPPSPSAGQRAIAAPTPAPLLASPPPLTAADRRAAMPAALQVERRWLQSWFNGTPVLIAQRDDGSLSIDVPLDHCFEPGRAQVKPALGVVLEKVAESLRRLPHAGLSQLAAPDDAVPGSKAIAVRRAIEVQRRLRAAGVAAERLGRPTATAAAAVQLRIELAEP